MSVRFSCLRCGQHIEADESMVEQNSNCPNCQTTVAVPRDSMLQSISKPSEPDIFFSCGKCSQKLVVASSGARLNVNCPKCNAKLVVPTHTPDKQPKTDAVDWAIQTQSTKYEMAIEWAKRKRLIVRPVARFYDTAGTFWGQGYMQLSQRLIEVGLIKQNAKGFCMNESHSLYVAPLW